MVVRIEVYSQRSSIPRRNSEISIESSQPEDISYSAIATSHYLNFYRNRNYFSQNKDHSDQEPQKFNTKEESSSTWPTYHVIRTTTYIPNLATDITTGAKALQRESTRSPHAEDDEPNGIYYVVIFIICKLKDGWTLL